MEWEERINEKVEGREIAKGGEEEDTHGKMKNRKRRRRGGEQEQEELGGEIGEEDDCGRNEKWRGLATIEERI
jgi:hypothetical protein